jgi:hypothetical protein
MPKMAFYVIRRLAASICTYHVIGTVNKTVSRIIHYSLPIFSTHETTLYKVFYSPTINKISMTEIVRKKSITFHTIAIIVRMDDEREIKTSKEKNETELYRGHFLSVCQEIYRV